MKILIAVIRFFRADDIRPYNDCILCDFVTFFVTESQQAIALP